jgi:hypothetical protein
VIRQGPCDAPEKPCHKPTSEDQTAFKPIRCITSTKLFGARRPHTPAKPGFQFQTLPTKNAIQQDVQKQSGGLMQTGHARVPSRGSGLAQIGLRRKRTLHIHLRLGYFEPFDSSPGELRGRLSGGMAKVPTMSNIWSSYTNLFLRLTRCFEDRTDRLLRIRNGKRRRIHE